MSNFEIYWAIVIISLISLGYLFFFKLADYDNSADVAGFSFVYMLAICLALVIGLTITKETYAEIPNTKVIKFDGNGRVVVFWTDTDSRETSSIGYYLMHDSLICINKTETINAYLSKSLSHNISKCKN